MTARERLRRRSRPPDCRPAPVLAVAARYRRVGQGRRRAGQFRGVEPDRAEALGGPLADPRALDLGQRRRVQPHPVSHPQRDDAARREPDQRRARAAPPGLAAFPPADRTLVGACRPGRARPPSGRPLPVPETVGQQPGQPLRR